MTTCHHNKGGRKMKKRVVQALGCILAMTMVVGSLTACGGKSEKKAEKKQEAM